jgi:hypothetical protein
MEVRLDRYRKDVMRLPLELFPIRVRPTELHDAVGRERSTESTSSWTLLRRIERSLQAKDAWGKELT